MSKLYVVEDIIGKREIDGVVEYRVKWEGYPDSECTWEPKSSFCQSKAIVARFERSIRARQQSLSPIRNDFGFGAIGGTRRSSSSTGLECRRKITKNVALVGSSKHNSPKSPLRHLSKSPPRTPERPKRVTTGSKSGSGGKQEQLKRDVGNDSDSSDYGDPPELEPAVPLDATGSHIASLRITSPIASRVPTSPSSSSPRIAVSSCSKPFVSGKASSVSPAAKASASRTKASTASLRSKSSSLSPKLGKSSDRSPIFKTSSSTRSPKGSTSARSPKFRVKVKSPILKTPARLPKTSRASKSKSSASDGSPKDSISFGLSKCKPPATTTGSPRTSTSARSPAVNASPSLASAIASLQDAPSAPLPDRVSAKQLGMLITSEIAEKAISSPPTKTIGFIDENAAKTLSSKKLQPQASSSGSKIVKEPAIKSILKRKLESSENSGTKRARSPGRHSSSLKNTKATEPKSKTCKRNLSFENTEFGKVIGIFDQPNDNQTKASRDKPAKLNKSGQDEQLPAPAKHMKIQELDRQVQQEATPNDLVNSKQQDHHLDESEDVDIEGLEIEVLSPGSATSTVPDSGYAEPEGGPSLPTLAQNSVAAQTNCSIACYHFNGIYVGLHGTSAKPFTSVRRFINVQPAPEPKDRYIYLAEFDDKSRAWLTSDMATSYPTQLLHFFHQYMPLEFEGKMDYVL